MEHYQYYQSNVFLNRMDFKLFNLFYPNIFFVCLIVNCKTLYILILLYIKLVYIHYVLDRHIFLSLYVYFYLI